jgi:pimeloyl-ACP methyl ester carboxylesterase
VTSSRCSTSWGLPRPIYSVSASAVWSRTRSPTLLIFGDRDFSPLPDVVETFGLLPDAQLAVLPGTTHVGVIRRPGEVLALITPFLDTG